MGFTFNYFKHIYPEKVKFRDLTEEELSFIDTHFAEKDFLDFLKEEGYCSYGNGFFHFTDPQEHASLFTIFNNIPSGHFLFFRTAFGDFFTSDGEQVFVMHINTGVFNELSENLFDFFKFSLGDTHYINKTLYKELFDATVIKFGHLQHDECFGFIKPINAGGTESVNNIHKIKFKEYASSLGAL